MNKYWSEVATLRKVNGFKNNSNNLTLKGGWASQNLWQIWQGGTTFDKGAASPRAPQDYISSGFLALLQKMYSKQIFNSAT